MGCLWDVGVADTGKTVDVELDKLTDPLTDPWLLGGLMIVTFC